MKNDQRRANTSRTNDKTKLRKERVRKTEDADGEARRRRDARLCSASTGGQDGQRRLLKSYLTKFNRSPTQRYVFVDVPDRIVVAARNPTITQSTLKTMINHERTLERQTEKFKGEILDDVDRNRLRRNAIFSVLKEFDRWPACRQTRFLAAEYLGRFLTLINIDSSTLSYRAAASTCFSLACKVEEVLEPPEDPEFSGETMTAWEMALLKVLNWQTNIPTVFTFLFLFYHGTNLVDDISMGRTILGDALSLAEVCVLDPEMFRFDASIKAIGCFMTALKRHDIKDWFKSIDLLGDKENTSLLLKDCLALLSVHDGRPWDVRPPVKHKRENTKTSVLLN